VTPEQLILKYRNLVYSAVWEISPRLPSHVDTDDLASAGMVGLVQAARSFNPERVVPFKAWASIRIRGAILDELRAADWASRSVRRLARERDEGLAISDAAHLEADLARANLLSLNYWDSSGDVDESWHPPDPALTPEEVALHKERVRVLTAAVAELPDRHRAVVLGFALESRSITELAQQLGITESRISQLRGEAVGLLREAFNTVHDDQLTRPKLAAGLSQRRVRAYAERVVTRLGVAA